MMHEEAKYETRGYDYLLWGLRRDLCKVVWVHPFQGFSSRIGGMGRCTGLSTLDAVRDKGI